MIKKKKSKYFFLEDTDVCFITETNNEIYNLNKICLRDFVFKKEKEKKDRLFCF